MTTPPRPRCAHGCEPGECDNNTCPNWNWRARSDHAFDAVHAPQSEADLHCWPQEVRVFIEKPKEKPCGES
jgi:hypothetical protein